MAFRGSFGPFALDVAERRLAKGGQPVALTPKAFDLLALLIERRDHIVTKDELIARVWGGLPIDEHNIQVTVSMLRRALEDGTNGLRYVETVPRHGYRFIGQVAETGDPAGTTVAAPVSVAPVSLGRRRSRPLVAITTGALVLVGILTTVWIWRSRHAADVAPDLTSPSTREASVVAIQDYVEARSLVDRRTREDLEKGAGLFERATREDPRYALAYAGLAEAYESLSVRSYIAPDEGRKKAHDAAEEAVHLAPGLADTHAALGLTFVAFAPYDFATGDRELQHALALNPGLGLAHLYLGASYMRQGRLDDALAEVLRARELDPLSAIVAREVAVCYYLKRDYARARMMLRDADAISPQFTTTSEIAIYIQTGAYVQALADLARAMTGRPDDPILIFGQGIVYAAQGNREDALEAVARLEQLPGSAADRAHWIAQIWAALGDTDRSIEWLDRGLTDGSLGAFCPTDPVWDSLRTDPRFAAVVQRAVVPSVVTR